MLTGFYLLFNVSTLAVGTIWIWVELGWQPTPVFLPGESLWTEEPGRLQFMGSQRVGHKWMTKHCTAQGRVREIEGINLSYKNRGEEWSQSRVFTPNKNDWSHFPLLIFYKYSTYEKLTKNLCVTGLFYPSL